MIACNSSGVGRRRLRDEPLPYDNNQRSIRQQKQRLIEVKSPPSLELKAKGGRRKFSNTQNIADERGNVKTYENETATG